MTAPMLDFRVSTELARDLRSWRTRALLIGILGTIACAIGFFVDHNQFYRSYLWAYVFYVGVSVGSLAWLMVQYLTGGAWGVVIHRPAEAAARTLPLVALMFIPVAIGIPNLYLWSHPTIANADAVLRHKETYLNVPFFLGRAVLYLGMWNLISYLLNRWSLQEDRQPDPRLRRKMAIVSGPGLVFWGFSVTFMAVDWVLSINPHWFSTMFGLLFMVGQGLSSLAFLITVLVMLSYRRPMSEVLTPRHLHDVGKLLLATVMVWAYFSFSQFLIIWAGNLPEEITWYIARLGGGWQYRRPRPGLRPLRSALRAPALARSQAQFQAAGVHRHFHPLMRFVDIFWQVAPDFSHAAFHVSWLDFAAPIGIGGLWLAYFLYQLERRPLIPLNDPHLVEALEHGR